MEASFEIATENLVKEIDKSAATFTIPVKTSLDQSDWNVESTEKWARARKSMSAGESSSITVTVDENTDSRSAQRPNQSYIKHKKLHYHHKTIWSK